MTEEQFKQRTKQLALRVIRLVSSLPANKISDVIGKFYARLLLLAQIIGLFVEANQRLILLTNLPLLKKNLMKHSIG